nr:MAG TPA: hypothetical protein [Caudoviricetes sp.]
MQITTSQTPCSQLVFLTNICFVIFAYIRNI